MLYVSRKFAPVLLSALVALVLTLVTALVLTALYTRLDGDFVARWLRAGVIAYAAALPTALIATPVLKRLVDRISR